MNRLQALELRMTEYPYKKNALKLSHLEQTYMRFFIEKNDHLGHLEFEYAVNRMFLDAPAKTKNSIIMQELLTVANTCAKGKKNE